jgi:hypothetical protein
MTRVLAITPEVQSEIKAAVERAAKHPISPAECERLARAFPQNMDEIKLADRPPDFHRPESVHVNIPIGFRASFSFEHQSGGLCRHLSVSVDTPGRVPNLLAMGMIAEAFGFVSGAPRKFWTEEFEPGHHAINVIELVIDKGPDTSQ